MPNFCSNCGAALAENAACTCSAATPPPTEPAAQQTTPPAAQQSTQQPPPPPPPQYTKAPAKPRPHGGIVCSVLAYSGIFWLFGLCLNPEKNNPAVRFHTGQGIILTIFYFGANFALGIIGGFLTAIFAVGAPGSILSPATVTAAATTGAITSLLFLALTACYIYMAVKGIINVARGVQEPLPFIGNLAFYR